MKGLIQQYSQIVSAGVPPDSTQESMYHIALRSFSDNTLHPIEKALGI
jgi:hypothetical protein